MIGLDHEVEMGGVCVGNIFVYILRPWRQTNQCNLLQKGYRFNQVRAKAASAWRASKKSRR